MDSRMKIWSEWHLSFYIQHETFALSVLQLPPTLAHLFATWLAIKWEHVFCGKDKKRTIAAWLPVLSLENASISRGFFAKAGQNGSCVWAQRTVLPRAWQQPPNYIHRQPISTTTWELSTHMLYISMLSEKQTKWVTPEWNCWLLLYYQLWNYIFCIFNDNVKEWSL